jgi:hypothetical protein
MLSTKTGGQNLPICHTVSLNLVTTLTVSPNHIASEIQVPHCFYTVGNDTLWEEKETVQPFTAVMPLVWHEQIGHYRLLNVNRLTVTCALQWQKSNRKIFHLSIVADLLWACYTNILQKRDHSVFYYLTGQSTFLYNVSKCLPNYTVSIQEEYILRLTHVNYERVWYSL